MGGLFGSCFVFDVILPHYPTMMKVAVVALLALCAMVSSAEASSRQCQIYCPRVAKSVAVEVPTTNARSCASALIASVRQVMICALWLVPAATNILHHVLASLPFPVLSQLPEGRPAVRLPILLFSNPGFGRGSI